MEGRIISAEAIAENLKTFGTVYQHLTQEERYDLVVHLLVKKIVYDEEPEADGKGRKRGTIKLDLWELPPIGPIYLDSADGFAERRSWLPGQDSNLQPTG